MKIVDLINYNSDILNKFIKIDNNTNEFDRIINNDNSPGFDNDNNKRYNNKSRIKHSDELSDNDLFTSSNTTTKYQSMNMSTDKKAKVSPSNLKFKRTPSPNNNYNNNDNKLSISKLEIQRRNLIDNSNNNSPLKNRINPFQARLKKAQQAFSALKDTHSD